MTRKELCRRIILDLALSRIIVGRPRTLFSREKRQYVSDPSKAPDWAALITTKRGKHYYKPNQQTSRLSIIHNALKRIFSDRGRMDKVFDRLVASNPHDDNPISTYLAEILGFHSPPTIISDNEFNQMEQDPNIITMRRGVGGKSTPDFIAGKNKIQRNGAYGAGCYTAECNIVEHVDAHSFGATSRIDEINDLLDIREGHIDDIKESKVDLKIKSATSKVISRIYDKISKIDEDQPLTQEIYKKLSEDYDEIKEDELEHLSVKEYKDAIDDLDMDGRFNETVSKFHQENSYLYDIGDSEFNPGQDKWRSNFKSYLEMRSYYHLESIHDINKSIELSQSYIPELNEFISKALSDSGVTCPKLGGKSREELSLPRSKSKDIVGAERVVEPYGEQLLKFALDPTAQIGDFNEIKMAKIDYKSLGLSGGKDTNAVADHIERDIGTKALILGYDAMRISKEKTNVDLVDYMLVFNRGKIKMVMPPIDQQ